MVELSKILQKEESQKKAVETAKKEAQAEIEQKKQSFVSALETTGIGKQQEDKVLEYKKEQTKQIKKTIEENFETQLKVLQKKGQTNSSKATEYVVKSLFSD